MPSLGADMEAGTLVQWMVKPGQQVKRGDIVCVVETQKGAIEVEIFESGTIAEILVQPGAEVPVGAPLALLRVEGEPAAAIAPPQPAAPAPPQPAPPQPAPPQGAPEPPLHRAHGPRASPAARNAAQALGVDLSRVTGGGPGGAISREDVERAAAEKAVAPQPSRKEGMRQAIAAAMSRSKREIPHYYLSQRVDLSRALTWLKAENQRREVADRLLPVALILKAVALAARRHPEMNGFFKEGAFEPAPDVHLGVAISLKDGLVAPALHSVGDKPLTLLMRELSDLIARARRGGLRSSELSDSTLTVTSLGDNGAEAVFGIIFPPQVALVGIGRIVERACVVSGQCLPRPTADLSLAADHRVSDGLKGSLFLTAIDRLLQEPEAL